MTKEQLLEELSGTTYVGLRPSPVHGIGVFALCDIPKGCRDMFSPPGGEWIKIPITDIEKLPGHSRNLVETYCLFDEENYFVPATGFKVMDLVNFLNHSSTPNLCSINDGEFFEALEDIPAGTELLINYYGIVDAEGY